MSLRHVNTRQCWTWALALMTGLSACKQEAPPAGKDEPGATSDHRNRTQEEPLPTVAAKTYAQKVWILGFDGVDPNWLRAWMDEGLLPNTRRLIDQGGFYPLRSTHPPQSPVAWSSFATGTNPGQHGVFDFLRRDPRSYLPSVGSGEVIDAGFGPDGTLTRPPSGVTHRSGESFWHYAASQGVQSTVLNVPFAFPPELMPLGAVFSGLGTPDLRGTNSTFTYFSTALTPEDARKGVPGGRLVPLRPDGDSYRGDFDGPAGPQGQPRATVGLELRPDATAQAVQIRLGDQTATVAVGAWSDWFDYRFQVTPHTSVRALGRCYVVSLEPLEVFMYPPNIHPDEPWIPFTSPTAYGKNLLKKVGPFKTVGWTHDTSALNSEKLDDKPWLQDVFHAMDKLVELGLREASENPGSLFIWVETATDRVPHMMTRVTDAKSPRYDAGLKQRLGGDPILQTYQRMDAAIGKFLDILPADTTLLVMSDHGFHTYRRGLNTNAWLLQEGYLTLLPEKTAGGETNLFGAVDWSRTRAYSLGTGQIYLNLLGREGQGVVKPAEVQPLLDELVGKLQALTDPVSGEKPLVRAYQSREIYTGTRMGDAPDLQLAFAEGWRTSWQTMLGGIPTELFTDNTKKWSGDHAASDVDETSGILLTNQRLAVDNPAIIDLAPTVLSIFGLEKPASMEGRDLFAGRLTRPPTQGR